MGKGKGKTPYGSRKNSALDLTEYDDAGSEVSSTTTYSTCRDYQAEDVDDTYNHLLEELLEKRTTTREKAWSSLVAYLRDDVRDEDSEKHEESTIQRCLAALRKGGPLEMTLAATVLGLHVVSLPEPSERLFRSMQADLQKAAAQGRSPEARAAATEALALVCFVAAEDDHTTIEVMNKMQQLWRKGDGPTRAAALRGWSLLFTSLNSVLPSSVVERLMAELAGLLHENKVVEVRSAVGEAITLLYHTSCTARRGSDYEDSEEEGHEGEEGEGDEEEDEDMEEEDEEEDGDKRRSVMKRKGREPAPAAAEGAGAEVPDLDVEEWTHKMTPLHLALVFGRVSAARLLIGAGATATKPWVAAVGEEGKKVTQPVSMLLQLSRWNAPAATELLHMLREAGCSLSRMDEEFNTYLHQAAAQNNAAFITLLLEEAPDQVKPLLDTVNASLNTALQAAISAGYAEVARVLLAAGAKLELSEADCERARQVFNSFPAIMRHLPHYTRQNMYKLSAGQMSDVLRGALYNAIEASAQEESGRSSSPAAEFQALAAAAGAGGGGDASDAAREAAAMGGQDAPDVDDSQRLAARWFDIIKQILDAGVSPNAYLFKDGSLLDYLLKAREACVKAVEVKAATTLRLLASRNVVAAGVTKRLRGGEGAAGGPVESASATEAAVVEEARVACWAEADELPARIATWQQQGEELVGALVGAALEEKGMPVSLTRSGEDALAAFASRYGPDCYLMPTLRAAVLQESTALMSYAAVATFTPGLEQRVTTITALIELMKKYGAKRLSELGGDGKEPGQAGGADSEGDLGLGSRQERGGMPSLSINESWLKPESVNDEILAPTRLGLLRASQISSSPPGLPPVKYYMLKEPAGTDTMPDNKVGYRLRVATLGVRLPASCQAQYFQLFQSVWEGDVAAVQALTAPPSDPQQQQVFVSVADSYRHTPLSLAVLKGDVAMVELIAKLAAEQFKPPHPEDTPPAEEQGEEQAVPKLNNYALAAALEEAAEAMDEDSEGSEGDRGQAGRDEEGVVDEVRALRAAAEEEARRTQRALRGVQLDPNAQNKLIQCHVPPQVLFATVTEVALELLGPAITGRAADDPFGAVGVERFSEMWELLKVSDRAAVREMLYVKLGIDRSEYWCSAINTLLAAPVSPLSCFQLAVLLNRPVLLEALLSSYLAAAEAAVQTASTAPGAKAKLATLSDPLSELVSLLEVDVYLGGTPNALQLAVQQDSLACLKVLLRYVGCSGMALIAVYEKVEKGVKVDKAADINSGGTLYSAKETCRGREDGGQEGAVELVGGLLPGTGGGAVRKLSVHEELEAALSSPPAGASPRLPALYVSGDKNDVLLSYALKCQASEVLSWLLTQGADVAATLQGHAQLVSRYNLQGRRNLAQLCTLLQRFRSLPGRQPGLSHFYLPPALVALASGLDDSDEWCGAVLAAHLMCEVLVGDSDQLNGLYHVVTPDDPELIHLLHNKASAEGRAQLVSGLAGTLPPSPFRTFDLSPLQCTAFWLLPRSFKALLDLGAPTTVADPVSERGWSLLAFMLAGVRHVVSRHDVGSYWNRVTRMQRERQAQRATAEALASCLDMVRCLLDHAVAKGGPGAAAALISERMGRSGATPLMLATATCPPEVVELLHGYLEAAAAAPSTAAVQGIMGRTGLHLAVQSRLPKAVQAVLPTSAAGGINSAIAREDFVGLTPVDISMASMVAKQKELAGNARYRVVELVKGAAEDALLFSALQAAAPDLPRKLPTMEAVQESRAYKTQVAKEQKGYYDPYRYASSQNRPEEDPALKEFGGISKPRVPSKVQGQRVPDIKSNRLNYEA